MSLRHEKACMFKDQKKAGVSVVRSQQAREKETNSAECSDLVSVLRAEANGKHSAY